jgi:L-lactate dehydrogenase (cytochrome)
MPLSRCHNIDDLHRLARRRLPMPIYEYLAGGADDEWTLRRNTEAFDDYELMPSQLRDVSSLDTKTSVLGLTLDWPVLLAPTGMSRLFHHEAEPAVARAAARAGTLYSLSTVATTTLEEIAALTPGPKMFQLYIFRDRGLTSEFIQRCRAAGYAALCLTVDTVTQGNRERDRRSGMMLPPRWSLASAISFATHPRWSLRALAGPKFDLANVSHRVEAARHSTSLMEFINSQFDRTLTWDDAAWLVREWGGPVVIKGVQSADDARRALDIGARGIMISNHGGRQLEGAPAPVDCVRAIRDRVGSGLDVIVDGGVRRGNHVVKAIALGANACSIGRPYLYGLAAGGERGVDRALALLRNEIEVTMALLGTRSIAEITATHVQHRPRCGRSGAGS